MCFYDFIAAAFRTPPPTGARSHLVIDDARRFSPILGYLKEEKVGAYNWGFIDGKSQTIYPWDSWQKLYAAEPPVWFHDIFRVDGAPYDAKEVEYIRKVTGVK